METETKAIKDYIIENYRYKEINVNNLNGLILENAQAPYCIIRISEEEISDSIIMHFKGYYEAKSNRVIRILNIVLKDGTDSNLSDVDIIHVKGFEDFKNNNLIKEFAFKKSSFTTDDKDALDSEKIRKALSSTNMAKNTRFTRTLLVSIIFINVSFGLLNTEIDRALDLSYYSLFVDQFDQWYRIFTNVFLTNDFSIIGLILVLMYLMQITSLIEIKLGTTKLAIVFLISLINVYLGIYFLNDNVVTSGIGPIVMILIGAFFASRQVKVSGIQFISIGPSVVSFVFLLFIVFTSVKFNILTISIGFVSGFISVLALNGANVKVNKNYLLSIAFIPLMILLLSLYNNPTVNRDTDFETQYFEHIKSIDQNTGAIMQQQIRDYYDNLGVITFE